MKLKRLVIQGFKSFKDRTTIHFDEGITGIVGPNGCGKSNIVDALFWVMGEQSAKHLRGNSMKDVIFAGSSKYNPGSWAEVSLVLDNDTKKHIHIGQKVSSPSEIQLTRKLYRNGESEYRINDLPSRLKDIQEVFMDTGAGSKSYSIIAQGEINRLVQAKPEERRMMIEEVAGITKFKIRKRESLRKIDQTQANMSRLSDLKNEIEKNLKSLKSQSEKAEKARSLKEKIKKGELITNSHKVFDLLKKYKDGKNSVSEKKIEIAEKLKEKDTLEIFLEEKKLLKEENVEKVELLQDEFNTHSKELASNESKLQGLIKLKEEKESLVERFEREKKLSEVELEKRIQKKEEVQEKLEELEVIGEQNIDFEEEEEKLSTLMEGLEEKEEDLRILEGSLTEENQRLLTVDQDLFKNTSKIEELSKNLEDINKEIEEVEKRYLGFSSEVVEERREVQDRKEELQVLEKQEEDSIKEIDDIEIKFKESKKAFDEANSRVIQEETMLKSLRELRDSLEGAESGTSDFLGENKDHYQLFGNVIDCEEKYEKGVQVLLNDFLDVVISKDDKFQEFCDWQKEHSEKTLDIFVSNLDDLSSVSDGFEPEVLERLNLAGYGDAKKLFDVISIPENMKTRLKETFSGFYLVDSLKPDDFCDSLKTLNFKRIVSADGKVLIKKFQGGKIINCNLSDTSSLLEQNNKIKKLEEDLIVSRQTFKDTEEILAKLEQELNEKKELQKSVSEKKQKVREEYRVKKSGLEIKLENHNFNSSRLNVLKERKQDFSQEKLGYIEGEETIRIEKEELEEKLETFKVKFEELEQEVQVERKSYEAQKEDFLRKKIEIDSFEEKLKAFKDQSIDLNEQIETQKERIQSYESSFEESQNTIESLEEETKTLTVENKEKAEELSDKEELLGNFKDELADLLLEMEEKGKLVKNLSSRINKLEKDVLEFETKSERFLLEEEEIVKNIFEKYKIDLRKSVGKFLNFIDEDYEELNSLDDLFVETLNDGTEVQIEKESFEFQKRFPQEVKEWQSKFKNYKAQYNALGEINWQAIEDYNHQKVRFDFLKDQEDELSRSLLDLEAAIAQIDKKSKERFKEAFLEVNERFEKVFPIIFGGGESSLKITGGFDDPDAGIDIIARPPGKKMQNINLMSGGEKALTAVSLIFSIFLVKPSPFCLLDEVDAPLDDANVGRFNDLLREMSSESQFILITHNKKTMELNDRLYGVTMQEPGISKTMSIQLQ